MSTPKRSLLPAQKVRVTHYSLLDTDLDSDHLNAEDPAIVDFLDDSAAMKALTRRQRPVAKMLAQGYTREEIAAERGVCLQAIHQMVLVMRKRLRNHIEKTNAI